MNTPYMLMLLALFCLLSSVESAKPITFRDACNIPTDDPRCARLPRKDARCTTIPYTWLWHVLLAGCNCPKKQGPLGYIRNERYFYNKRSRTCEFFAWSGEDGNCNNFRSYRDCIQACTN
uniref:Putative bpti/kunitz family of serine protease inhibitor n=1 Tax=Amblyomma tuberculatum TaxID=48802 RepID=A0A6M2E6F6_9ACAR